MAKDQLIDAKWTDTIPDPILHSLLQKNFDNNPAAILMGRSNGDIILANKAASELFGFTKDELKKLGRSGIVVQDDLDAKLIAERLHFGKATGTMNFRRKNGKLFKGMVYTNLIHSFEDSYFTNTTIVKISEQENLEFEIKERNRYLNTLLNCSSDYMSVVDRSGKRKLLSKSAETLLGYTKTEIDAIAPIDLVYKDDKEEVLWHLKHVEELKGDEITESRLVHKNGHTVAFSWSYNMDRETGDICLVGRDITREQKIEEALRERESRLKAYLEFAGEAVLMHDYEGNIKDLNKQACIGIGYTEQEFAGINMADLVMDMKLFQFQSIWNRLQHNSSLTLNGNVKRKNGTVFAGELKISCFYVLDKPLFLTLIRDISTQKSTEAKLLKLNNELKIRNAELLKHTAELEKKLNL